MVFKNQKMTFLAIRLPMLGVVLILVLFIAVFPVHAVGYLPVFGGPTYTPGEGGYLGTSGIASNGFALGNTNKYDSSGNLLGKCAVRWDASGAAAVELAGLSGFTESRVSAINDAGTMVGSVGKYDAAQNYAYRPVRWDASGTIIAELGNLGTDANGSASCSVISINGAGTMVGYGKKYDVDHNDLGYRAICWNASDTTAVELADSTSFARGINNEGTITGSIGSRAVRWDASGAVTELGTIAQQSTACAYGINDAGMIQGTANVVSASKISLGQRVVRWDASGAAAELGHLGTMSNGFTVCMPEGINAAGTAIGYVNKFDDSHDFLGIRAVRWDASETAAVELEILGTTSYGYSTSVARAINDSGIIVGEVQTFDSSDNGLGDHAVYWKDDGTVVDLNTLIDPTSGWTLTMAMSISETGWIVGLGTYDPDGAGGQDAYDRLFLMQVPEPSTMVLLLGGLLGMFFLRRWCS